MSGIEIFRVCKKKIKYGAGSSTEKPRPRELRRLHSNASRPLQIIELQDKCLERIFDYLNVTDLNNVASAHPHLISAARAVFQRKHSKDRIFMSLNIIRVGDASQENYIDATPTTFFNNFGKLISKLSLFYLKDDGKIDRAHHWREIEDLIFENCNGTLKKIDIFNCNGNGNFFEPVAHNLQYVWNDLCVTISNIFTSAKIKVTLPATGKRVILRSAKQKNENEAGSSAKQLMTVNDDCLEHIFGYLDATDLNNVADAHPRFVPAAREVFKRKYSNKWIQLADSGLVLKIYNEIDDSEEFVEATPSSFLANFGNLIKSLELDYENIGNMELAHHWREIEQIIYKHCSKTLTYIMLIDCRGNVMEKIRSPFNKVMKLVIINGFTETTNVDLCNWFPNTRILNVNGTAVHSVEYMKGHFQFLEELKLSEDLDEDDDEEEEEEEEDHEDDEKELFKLFKKGDRWIDFIVKNKSITSLLYNIENKVINIVDLIKIVKELPNLNTFRFCARPMYINDIIHLLKVCKPMQHLKTIGKLACEEKNLKKNITILRNRMDDELKSIFASPIIQSIEDEFMNLPTDKSMDFCRK